MLSKLLHEEKLQFSELRYRRLFETAQDGILILDAVSGKIDDANPFLQKLLGYSEPELLGKQLWEIGVFKDIIDSKEAFAELQNKGYIRYGDLPLQTKDGRKVNVEFISNVYKVGTQKVIQCNIRDITQRKKAEETAEETKKAMLNVMEDLEQAKTAIEIKEVTEKAIITNIGDGLVVVDCDMRITLLNPAAEALIGWSSKEVVGKIWQEVIDLRDKDGKLIPLDKRPLFLVLHQKKPTTTTTTTYFYTRKNKTMFPVAITVSILRLESKHLGAIIVFRDITREQEIDKAKSEFVSLASHQLRTPLGIIKWYLEALGNEDYFNKAPQLIRGYIDEINKSNERVLGLVRDLLSVSRIEQGRVKNVPISIDLVQTMKEIVKQMQLVAGKKKVTLHLTVQDSQIPPISIDIIRFHEVIENLIINAIEYTETLGKVDVAIKKTGATVSISVKDTGIGIAETDREKIFTKFFRSEKATSYNPAGTGLGLYVVKSYAEGWGGKVSVESKEGKGSTFTVSLPISQK